MIDVRCKACNRLLLKAVAFIGAVKCHRCGLIIEYKVLTNNLHINEAYDIKDSESTETLSHSGKTTSVK